jgi:hypothetical protein
MLTAKDAETIARKLDATFKSKTRRHKIAIIRLKGKEVGRFGIRRGSGDLGHDYIPRQIHVSNSQARELADCKLYLRD